MKAKEKKFFDEIDASSYSNTLTRNICLQVTVSTFNGNCNISRSNNCEKMIYLGFMFLITAVDDMPYTNGRY